MTKKILGLGVLAVTLIVLVSLWLRSHGDHAAATAANAPSASTEDALLNVSYDPTRELYQAINPLFAAKWKAQTGHAVQVRQSHSGSGAQARAIRDGLEADVATLALGADIDALAKAGLIPTDWAKRLPLNSTPFSSVIVLVVRKGNPKHIHDWDDLVRPDVSIVTPNPKTSGGARWNYLAAWAYALDHDGHDEAKTRDFLARLYRNVPVLDTGARGATITFSRRGVGDVLIAWENEAKLLAGKRGEGEYEVIYPSLSIQAETPVTIVDRYADKHGTQKLARAYLDFLYSDEAQEIAAQNDYRPSSPAVLARHRDQFPELRLVTIGDAFGGWANAQKVHFSDGGVFDQIYQAGQAAQARP